MQVRRKPGSGYGSGLAFVDAVLERKHFKVGEAIAWAEAGKAGAQSVYPLLQVLLEHGVLEPA